MNERKKERMEESLFYSQNKGRQGLLKHIKRKQKTVKEHLNQKGYTECKIKRR
jgi:hypothetical protein